MKIDRRREYHLCSNRPESTGPEDWEKHPICGNDTFRIELKEEQANCFCTKCGMALVIIMDNKEGRT